MHDVAIMALSAFHNDVLLLAEGVLYAEKDYNLAAHPEIADVPNLQVIKLMQSFKSKELVTERFAWRHYYWWVICSREEKGPCPLHVQTVPS